MFRAIPLTLNCFNIIIPFVLEFLGLWPDPWGVPVFSVKCFGVCKLEECSILKKCLSLFLRILIHKRSLKVFSYSSSSFPYSHLDQLKHSLSAFLALTNVQLGQPHILSIFSYNVFLLPGHWIYGDGVCFSVLSTPSLCSSRWWVFNLKYSSMCIGLIHMIHIKL